MEIMTTHFKDYYTNNNEMKKVLKCLVNDTFAVAEEAFRLRDDREKIKANAAKMKDNATKIKVELKLRKQLIKEVKYRDTITMRDRSIMSLTDAMFYLEKKAVVRPKRYGYSSSTK